MSQSANSNFALVGPPVSSSPTPAYNAEPYTLPIPYSVFQLQSSSLVNLYTSLNDSLEVSAYLDSACTQPAKGTLSFVNQNPLALSGGLAIFLGLQYSLPTTQEQTIYLLGNLVSSNLSVCTTTGVSVLQHFVLGEGYLATGVPNAGGSSSAPYINKGMVHQIDASGNYVVAGTSFNTTNNAQEMALWRILPTGVLDTTFGTQGFVHSGSSVAGAIGASEIETVTGLQIDSSGRYVVVGTSKNASNGTELAIWRYRSTGSLDTTFANNGTYHTGAPGLTGQMNLALINDQPNALQIDSDSHLVIAGQSLSPSGVTEVFVGRTTSGGVWDTSFATSGIYSSVGAAGGTSDRGLALAIDSSKNLIVAGSSACSTPLICTQKMTLWRLKSSGSLDSTFGSNGILTESTSQAGGTGANLSDKAMALQVDGTHYVLAGSSHNNTGGSQLALWRYSNSGTQDSSFQFTPPNSATGATGVTENDRGTSLTLDSSLQGYVITGTSMNSSGGTQIATWRYTNTGQLDSNFNSSGIVTTSATGVTGSMTASTVADSATSIQMDAVGTYTVIGSTESNAGSYEMVVLRYLKTGYLDQ